MSGFEIAAIILSLAASGVSILVALRVMAVVSQAAETVKVATDRTDEILLHVTETVAGVNVELARVDTILAGVQSITATADEMVGVMHSTVSNPLVKGASYVYGVRKGAKKLAASKGN